MDLAVIGGGPKAAAIAAKATALRLARYPAPNVTIFEPLQPAAMWTGQHGYTDGDQPLCTIAERDLGFPYDRDTFGPETALHMLSFFSWHSYAVTIGQGRGRYEDWVVQGRRPPAHTDFAGYVQNAIAQSKASHRAATVTAVDHNARLRKWEVTARDRSGRISSDRFDGVVVTGTGDPYPSLSYQAPSGTATPSPRVFNARDFWLNLPAVKTLLDADPDPSLAIIGGGGTGAAVAHWCVCNLDKKVEVTVISPEATLFMRSPSPFEDNLFTNGAAWVNLAPHVQREFVKRLSRGVVWEYVLRRLAEAGNVRHRCAHVRSFAVSPIGSPPMVAGVLDHPPDPSLSTAPPAPLPGAPPTAGLHGASVFVDARGFDPWWFEQFFAASPLRPYFAQALRTAMAQGVDYALDFSTTATPALASVGPFPPRLHVPMLATTQGPAAPNLMALGWMSDRIMSAYIPPTAIAARLGAASGGSPARP